MSLYRDTQEQRAEGWQKLLHPQVSLSRNSILLKSLFSCLCASSLNFISQNWCTWLPKLQRLAKWVFDIWNLCDRRHALPVGNKSEGIYSGWKVKLSATSYMAKLASRPNVSFPSQRQCEFTVTRASSPALGNCQNVLPIFAALILFPGLLF